MSAKELMLLHCGVGEAAMLDCGGLRLNKKWGVGLKLDNDELKDYDLCVCQNFT